MIRSKKCYNSQIFNWKLCKVELFKPKDRNIFVNLQFSFLTQLFIEFFLSILLKPESSFKNSSADFPTKFLPFLAIKSRPLSDTSAGNPSISFLFFQPNHHHQWSQQTAAENARTINVDTFCFVFCMRAF